MSVLGRLQEETFAGASRATTSSYPPERRLSGEVLDAVLAGPRYAVVSSTRGDGRPHATPVAYAFVGDEVWLPTVAGSARARNVREHPWLSFVVVEGHGDTHLAVIVEGPARVAGDAPPQVRAAIAERLGEEPAWASEWLVLTPRRVLSYAAEGWRLA